MSLKSFSLLLLALTTSVLAACSNEPAPSNYYPEPVQQQETRQFDDGDSGIDYEQENNNNYYIDNSSTTIIQQGATVTPDRARPGFSTVRYRDGRTVQLPTSRVAKQGSRIVIKPAKAIGQPSTTKPAVIKPSPSPSPSPVIKSNGSGGFGSFGSSIRPKPAVTTPLITKPVVTPAPVVRSVPSVVPAPVRVSTPAPARVSTPTTGSAGGGSFRSAPTSTKK